jgi:uncharacterized protein (TIGR02265 family)
VPTFDPDVPLTGEVDRDAMRQEIPSSYTVKGMFCADLAVALGSAFPPLLAKLEQPPRGGRYLTFTDYPQRDHLVLTFALCDKRFPGLCTRQAQRLLARQDVHTLGHSTVGRIMLALAGDATAALLRVPEVFRRVTKGQQVEATVLEDGAVRIAFVENYGGWEYNLGQVEGIVAHYGRRATVEVELPRPGYQTFVVRM